MVRRTLVFLGALLLVACPGLTWQGAVVEVRDARTLVIEHQDQSRTVSLYGIDCPKPSQPYGQQAVDLVSSLVLDREVTVTVHRQLSSRTLAEVTPLETKDSVNALLLENGLGWVHQAYCEKAELCGRWESIEGSARSAGEGFWPEIPENMPAWRWFKEEGMP